MRLPLAVRYGPIPFHCIQSNSVFPIENVRTLDMLGGTPESTEEHCYKSRGTLMSLQQCEIAQCTPNQCEMMPDFPTLAPEPSHVTY